MPAVSARAVSSARLVWCVSSCRAAFAFLFFSVASPLLSARCARAGRSAPCARCSGTVPAAPRAARCVPGSSSCCTAHRASPHDCHCHCFPQLTKRALSVNDQVTVFEQRRFQLLEGGQSGGNFSTCLRGCRCMLLKLQLGAPGTVPQTQTQSVQRAACGSIRRAPG